MRGNYNATIRACFGGYMVQAVINTFVPLLFLTLRREYGLSLEEISLLITVNFLVQLTVDLLAARFVDRIGYRVSVVAAHLFSAAGLVLLTVLPQWMPSLAGLLIAVAVYAVGGGLIEVLISPIVEACPTRHKESVMSLLHSFYCWGCVATILLSTLFFALLGTGPWRVLACLWALLPLVNGAIFTQVPLVSLTPEDGSGLSLRQLARQPAFWVLLLLMACAGASEHGVSQWASALAESALGVSKTVGDLAGYLLTALSPWPALSLAGCGLCGLAVGCMWPGTFSLAAGRFRAGGTALFALLALAGDLGCSAGPTAVGVASSALGGSLQRGILLGAVSPLLLMAGLLLLGRLEKKNP